MIKTKGTWTDHVVINGPAFVAVAGEKLVALWENYESQT